MFNDDWGWYLYDCFNLFTDHSDGSNDTIELAYSDTVSNQIASRTVTGTGLSPAALSISDGPTYNYGSQLRTTTTDKTFTVTNSGQVDAAGVSVSGLVSLFIQRGSYPGTGGTCSSSIAVGNCTIVVSYTPTDATYDSDTIQISYHDGAVTQTAERAPTGTGLDPASLSLSDGVTYDFGSQILTTTSEKTVTVTNNGGFSATSLSGSGLNPPFDFKGGGYPGTGGTCSGTIAVSGSCTIVVEYTPTTAGAQNDTIEIGYNNGLATVTAQRALSGTGLDPAALDISDGSTYDFGSQVMHHIR